MEKKYDFDLSPFNEVLPPNLMEIEEQTRKLGFDMGSERETGLFLRFLASLKPRGSFLEIGTGTGIGAAWLLDGMCGDSKLVSVDMDEEAMKIAKNFLDSDERVNFITGDGLEFLKTQKDKTFDFIFADTYPGKFVYLEETLNLLKPNGLYIVDDMRPQEDWPEDWFPVAAKGLEDLKKVKSLKRASFDYASGLIAFIKP